MARRTLLSPSTVRMSRPGVDVLNPPSLTPQHLAMDSSWTKVERLHTLALVPNRNFVPTTNALGDGPQTVLYSTLGDFPLARLIVRRPGTTRIEERLVGFLEAPGAPNPTIYSTSHVHCIAYTQADRLVLMNGVDVANQSWPQRNHNMGINSPYQKMDHFVMVFKP